MKKVLLIVCVLAAGNMAIAAMGDVSANALTGVWRFATEATKLDATMGAPLTTSNAGNSAFFLGPWTDLGVPEWHTMYSDGGCVQERSWDFLTVNPNFTANGSGEYVNEYTILMDYVQTSGLTSWNSLFQTADTGNASDGDLFTDGAGHIGIGDTGYSTLTYDASTWHRIVLSVDNGSFFRVYVDGALYLDGTPQGVDGRFSLYTDHFHLFADDSWEDQWGLVGLVATWNRALSTAEVGNMGGWLDPTSGMPTPLILVPEPATLAMLGLGGLALLRRRK